MQDERLPEDVLLDFLIANLRGREEEIRPLILDHPDASLLWQGAYPAEVAALLARQYEGMEIARLHEGPDRVSLQCSASPIPLVVVYADGEWRLDASPIIAFRRGAKDQA